MIQVNRGLQNEYVGCLYSFEYYPCDPSVRERYYAEITAIREQVVPAILAAGSNLLSRPFSFRNSSGVVR